MQMETGLLVVPTASLDSNVQINPQGHIYWGNKADWDDALGKVVKFDQLANQIEI
jgi:hypothetical protein